MVTHFDLTMCLFALAFLFFIDVISPHLLCVQNTASPWLHQAAGSAGDGLSLLSHVPIRPASADAHRPPVKISTHTSPPLSKASMDIHKE